MHHRGQSYNFPTGTLFTQLPGGIFAKHPDVPETHPGYGHLIRSSEDNIHAIHNALNNAQGVAEAKNTNPRVNEIRQLAKDFFGQNPYSSGTIGGGKILRLSFHVGRYLDGHYRYVPSTQISPTDQQTLKGIKSKFEKFMASKGVSADEVSIKFHIGSGVYAGVRIAIPQEEGVAESVDHYGDAERLKKQGDMKGYHKAMVRFYDAKADNASHRGDAMRYEKLANKHHVASKNIDEEKERLDPSCWKGYKKQGTKMKGDTRVNNCVPVKESAILKGLK